MPWFYFLVVVLIGRNGGAALSAAGRGRLGRARALHQASGMGIEMKKGDSITSCNQSKKFIKFTLRFISLNQKTEVRRSSCLP